MKLYVVRFEDDVYLTARANAVRAGAQLTCSVRQCDALRMSRRKAREIVASQSNGARVVRIVRKGEL